jgi:hypothetical protein
MPATLPSTQERTKRADKPVKGRRKEKKRRNEGGRKL